MEDLINLGAYPTDSIMGRASSYLTPNQLQQPLDPKTTQPNVEGSLLPKPTFSQQMLKTGMALLVADQEGTAAGVNYLAQEGQRERDAQRQARRDQLTEYELLGRIRERQLAELQARKNIQLSERLKKTNPDLADLIDLDPKKAAEVIAKRQEGGGPFSGTSMDAQTANILLQGDPSSDAYLAAYNMAAQPRISQGPDGSMVTITPDMSAYRLPTRLAGAMQQPQAIPQTEQAVTVPQSPSMPSSVYAPSGGITQTEGTSFGKEKMDLAGYAKRMDDALKLIDELPEGSDQAKTGRAGYVDAIIGGLTGVDSVGAGLVKETATEDQQRYLNAANEWIRAKLRKESGAVIGIDEMKSEYATYFPTAGDKPAVIEQKRKLREEVTKGMINSAGNAYTSLFSGSEKPSQSRGMLDDVDEATPQSEFSGLTSDEISNLAKEMNMTVDEVRRELGL